MERLTSTSSRGLAGWGNPSIPQSGFTLFLRVHSARNLAVMGRGSYCKLYLGNTEVVNGSTQAGASFSNLLVDKSQQSQSQLMMQPPTHRVFRTKVLYTDQKSCPEWNEKLELHVVNPDTEILTIRVKNQLMFFCPAIGACAIPLCNVRLGEPAEQWFPLHKGGKPAGHIRLQLLLKEKDLTVNHSNHSPVAVDESSMQRLIQQHCQQERERRLGQQSEEAMRRRQFEEQERMQMELRRHGQESQERERTRIEEMAMMQAFQEQMQREEQAKVQAYLQKQMQHEEDWHADGLAQKIEAVKIEEAPEDVGKEPSNSNNYFADDEVTASKSRHSSNSSGLQRSFTGSQGGSHGEQVPEAVEVTDIAVGKVVDNALPSSDSSSDGEGCNQRRDKDRRKQHSRKKSSSTKGNQLNSPSLFPTHSEIKRREDVPEGNLSSGSLADSSSSSETSSSEEERRRRRRRRRKEKKAKRKERRRRRKAKRKARRESDGYESSSSSSSSSTSSDEHHKRKTRKHKKTKERARSYRESKASSIPRAPVPPHSNSYGPDHYTKEKTSMYNQSPPTYARAQQQNGASPPGYIETLPPQPQQKRSMGEMISTAADVASILSDVASVATSVQQLTGGGDTGSGGGIPFAVPDISQFLGGQDLSGMLAGQDLSAVVGQDFSGLAGDTTAQYF